LALARQEHHEHGEPIRLLILDCDGVLVDSERVAIRVDRQVLTALGWPITEAEVVERFVGRTEAYMVSQIERHLGRSLPPDWEDEYRRLYQDAFAAELRPVEGVVEALDALDRMDLATCVASSGGHHKIEHSLRLCGLYERFAGRIFSAADVSDGKPAPDLFLHAARVMGAQPAEAVAVEDSPAGVDAALAAGMRVLGYGGGVVPATRLGHATAVFTDMRELPRLLQDPGTVTGSRA
jgi:HAD superfamily hydrolase (TIGR01509 family)